ncbi:MAG: hypothetical protein SFT93_01435 [Rickettsiaceae bacterium]|nr:hypothetical protein [Rickettsiaceae bacterium]
MSSCVIPVETGIQYSCHSLEGGDPGNIILLDSCLRRGKVLRPLSKI